MTGKSPIDKVYADLRRRGFRPERLAPSVLAFRKSCRSYFVALGEGGLYSVGLPCFYKLDGEEERRRALEVATTINSKVRGAWLEINDVKTDESNVSAVVEFFCSTEDAFLEICVRAVVAVDAARSEFLSSMEDSAA